MSLLQNIPSGPGSQVLVSQGAEDFDPDSLLELDLPTETVPTPASGAAPLVLLKFIPPLGDALEVAGILRSISAKSTKITLSFACLAQVGLELVQLPMGEAASILEECQVVIPGQKEPSKVIHSHCLLHKAVIKNIVDNRAEVKVEVRCP